MFLIPFLHLTEVRVYIHFQNPMRLLFDFDITSHNYPTLHQRYLDADAVD